RRRGSVALRAGLAGYPGRPSIFRRPRESGGPEPDAPRLPWIPAVAGMTTRSAWILLARRPGLAHQRAHWHQFEPLARQRRQPALQLVDGRVMRVADRDGAAVAARDRLGLGELRRDRLAVDLVVEEDIARRAGHADLLRQHQSRAVRDRA